MSETAKWRDIVDRLRSKFVYGSKGVSEGWRGDCSNLLDKIAAEVERMKADFNRLTNWVYDAEVRVGAEIKAREAAEGALATAHARGCVCRLPLVNLIVAEIDPRCAAIRALVRR